MSNEILDRNLITDAKEHVAEVVTCLQMVGTQPGNPGADYYSRLDANRASLGLPVRTPRRDGCGNRVEGA